MADDQEDDDPFDSLLNLESQHYTAGYDAGYRDGAAQSAIEGRIFGVEKAFEKFTLMGRLRRRAEVWAARYTDAVDAGTEHQEESGTQGRQAGAGAGANARLDRHIATLLLLTDAATLDWSNTDDAVAVFDDRLKRAQAKVKVVERLLGEEVSSLRPRVAGHGEAANGGLGAVAGGGFGDIENLKMKSG